MPVACDQPKTASKKAFSGFMFSKDQQVELIKLRPEFRLVFALSAAEARFRYNRGLPP